MAVTNSTRYRDERTLVRALRRLPGETRKEFRDKVSLLRGYCTQFNIDISEICQRIMGIRPDGKRADQRTRIFWEFFLEPTKFLSKDKHEMADKYRMTVFNAASGLEDKEKLSGIPVSDFIGLRDSVNAVAELALTVTAQKLFRRLADLSEAHRFVLLKVAAEWIFAHYVRGYENWKRQHEEWEKEKKEWEAAHPGLNETIRNEYNQIFSKLEIKDKRPRVCKWERLKNNLNDCEYAGERIKCGDSWRNHAALCIKFREYFRNYSQREKSFRKFFIDNLKEYLNYRKKQTRLPSNVVMRQFLSKYPERKWFAKAWTQYLTDLNITEDTIVRRYDSQLPHCIEFRGDKDCTYNKHTDKCEQYKTLVKARPELHQFEDIYREWRREYLFGPKKPSFKYPSGQKRHAPKIFGQDFFNIDFEKSIVRVRLDDMPKGEFLYFGFKPWPEDYKPTATEANITSVQIHFSGTKARVGFRFQTPHRVSRFGVSQDEIDELRSRRYPRQSQDGEFLSAARRRLIESFQANAERDMKILAVDLGTSSGCVGVFEGKNFKEAEKLRIAKVEKLYDAFPKKDAKDKDAEAQKKGLGAAHIGWHLESWAKEAKAIAESIQRQKSGISELGEYDLRGLSRHMRWMIRDWVRLNTSQIMELAEKYQVDLIVFESMRGFKAPGYDKVADDKKRRMAFFAYGRIRRKVAEKAVERGMRVLPVPYMYSSQVCTNCGKEQKDKNTWNQNKRKHIFECEQCHFKADSDENAARVLGRVFWGEVSLPTSR